MIHGEAESNARVSTYMRNLSSSVWLKDPNLTVIEIEDKTVNRISNFTLTVKQTSPNATAKKKQVMMEVSSNELGRYSTSS